MSARWVVRSTRAPRLGVKAMNDITKLIATTVVGLIITTIAVVIAMVVVGAGHAHAGMTSSPHTFAVSYIERGRHGGRS
jgi:hypothetical protein